jgi:uncharacterized protein (DUF2062 family)
VARLFDTRHSLRDLLMLVVLGAIGTAVYGGIILALFGRSWLKVFRARRRG